MLVIIILNVVLECVANVDEILGEIFLEEKTPTEGDILVGFVGCAFVAVAN